MYMLSCVIVIKFSQGDYEQVNWSQYTRFQKFCNYMFLCIVGYAVTLCIYFIDTFKGIFLLFVCPFGQSYIDGVENWFNRRKQKISGFDLYQLKLLKESTKVSQMIFENLPQKFMLIMILWVYSDSYKGLNETEKCETFNRLIES